MYRSPPNWNRFIVSIILSKQKHTKTIQNDPFSLAKSPKSPLSLGDVQQKKCGFARCCFVRIYEASSAVWLSARGKVPLTPILQEASGCTNKWGCDMGQNGGYNGKIMGNSWEIHGRYWIIT